jgi:hypothetical protein
VLIQLNNNEIRNIKRLGNAVNSGLVPFEDVRILLSGLRQKVERPAAGPVKKTSGVKDSRKNKYKAKLRIAS